MYLVFFCFKKPVKSENKIEILLPLVHWCESIHNKLQSLTTTCSRLTRIPDCVLCCWYLSLSVCLEATMNLVGSKRGNGGQTNLINKGEDTVVVINETQLLSG